MFGREVGSSFSSPIKTNDLIDQTLGTQGVLNSRTSADASDEGG
jgi:hypothetical protein